MRLFKLLLIPLLALGLFLPPLALSAAHAAPSPSLTLNPTSAAAGGTFTVSGTNFPASTTLVISLDSKAFSSTVSTSGAGSFGPASFTVPAGTSSGAHSVTASTTGGTLLASTALQVPAPVATILLTPASGPPGAGIRVDGSGFSPNESVSIMEGATSLATTTANGSGQISTSLTLPQRLGPGALTLTATGTTSRTAGSATYTVNAPTVTLSASSGVANGNLTAVGHNFAVGETVRVAFNGAVVAQPVADGSGSFSTTFAVPAGPSGAVTITSTGANSAIVVNTPFTRIGVPAALTLAPTTGAPGMHLTVSGSGFTPNEPVTISLGSSALASTTANSQGQISVSAALPQRLSPGTLTLVATGASSRATSSAAYVVIAPTLTLSASSGVSGHPVTAVGRDFAAGETVRLSANGAVVAQATADATGTFSTTFNMPSGPSGAVTVTATGLNSLITVNAPFTRTGVTVTANLTSVMAGGTLTLAGTGFAANEPIQISIPGGVLLNLHANVQGTFTTPLTISASQPVGTLPITATGLTSHLSGSFTVTVTGAPKITLNASSVMAGNRLTITGTGFGANEVVNLALGTTYLGRPTANAQGNFTFTATVPTTMHAATSMLVATGLQTHRVVQVGVSVLARVAAVLSISPSNPTPGSQVTISGSGFAPGERVTLFDSAGHQFATASANTQGSFSIATVLPTSMALGIGRISATGGTSHATAAATVTLAPLSALNTNAATWYFAAGQTTGGFDDVLAVLNPNHSAVQGSLTLYYGVGQTRVVPFSLAAEARGTYDIGRLIGAMPHVAAVVQANLPIAAARIGNKYGNNRMASAGVSAPSRTWSMAEGYTGLSFNETLFLLNPGSVPANVHISWPLGNGRTPVQYSLTVPARTQVLVPVNTYVKKASHATMITSDQPIVAARRLIFGTAQQGATLKPGLTHSATTLYFAEGSTANGFEEYLTIFNPDQTRAAQVTAQFHDRQGNLLGTRTITVDPMSRGTIKVNDVAHNSSIASVLHSTLPIVAERALYFGAPNGNSAGGTVVFGRSTPAMAWAFASGNTGSGQAEFDLLYNPNPQANQILITYHLSNGQTMQASFTVPANARMTVDLNRSVSGLQRGVHGVTMRSLSGLPFLAEQAIYNQSLTRGYALAGAPAS